MGCLIEHRNTEIRQELLLRKRQGRKGNAVLVCFLSAPTTPNQIISFQKYLYIHLEKFNIIQVIYNIDRLSVSVLVAVPAANLCSHH